jgi:hypothetical protein
MRTVDRLHRFSQGRGNRRQSFAGQIVAITVKAKGISGKRLQHILGQSLTDEIPTIAVIINARGQSRDIGAPKLLQ